MAIDGDTKNLITNYVYKADVMELRDKYKYEGTVELIAINTSLAGCGVLVSYAVGFVGQLITATVVLLLGIGASVSANRTQLYNLYSNLFDEMVKATNPVLYAKITQPMKYRGSGDGEGWLTNGTPTINKYYQDW